MTRKYVIDMETVYDSGDSYCDLKVPYMISRRECKIIDEHWYLCNGCYIPSSRVFDSLKKAHEGFNKMFIECFEEECITVLNRLKELEVTYKELKGLKDECK